jgi:hypothetical protein
VSEGEGSVGGACARTSDPAAQKSLINIHFCGARSRNQSRPKKVAARGSWQRASGSLIAPTSAASSYCRDAKIYRSSGRFCLCSAAVVANGGWMGGGGGEVRVAQTAADGERVETGRR